MIRPILIAVISIAAVTFACTARNSDPAPPDQAVKAEASPQPVGTSAAAARFFEMFPTGAFGTIAEAENVAGFTIPHPSSGYPMAFGQTHLHWLPKFSRPSSYTDYVYSATDKNGIIVEVGPSYYWKGGDALWKQGNQTNLGGKAGWEHTNGEFYFAYICGSVDSVNLWCVIHGGSDIDHDEYAKLVSTLT